MKKLIASEFQRIWINKKTKILLMLVIIDAFFGCIWEFKYYGSYDHVNYNVILNSLNFSPFAFGEGSSILFYLVLPIVVIDSINYERLIGAFRMYMIRPYEKYQYILSKWIALSLTMFMLMVIVFIISIIFGFIFMPKVSTVQFYNIDYDFSTIVALLYIAKFFLIQFFIAMFIVSMSTVIAVIIPNSVISILAVISLIIGLGGFTSYFKFLVRNCKYAFYTLGNAEPISQHFIVAAGIIGFLLIGMLLWSKKDYFN
ncbi:hypothetical protein psyc5s11_06790 [Clostridium gelidum]|uniref:ABC-2 family transporter protein n=1 Tax=Clostridium gelidum TaxID=704125 RepID=A0ABN6IW50_9CLOT|nr:ABC transporter permease [Clostridium gelidum]BCZ44612.1 hypothetical protein psyc5s11_06790 [Clostridium gelidum]